MPRDHDQSESATSLGSRVRLLRRERGLTLKALGRAAGLSHPFLSQLERGLARPSVSSVERIAGALGVPVRALWTVPSKRRPRLIRAGEGEANGVRALSGGDEALLVHEWSGANGEWPAETASVTGTVLVYVIRGAVELELDGKTHELAEGDALLFDGPAPHRLRRLGDDGTRALYVATA